jgi:hypothetical protein
MQAKIEKHAKHKENNGQGIFFLLGHNNVNKVGDFPFLRAAE